MLKIRIDPADGEPFERLFDQESMVVGRSSSSDLTLPDPFLSRFHARFFRDGDRILIEDLGSRNGTFLNGVAVNSPMSVEPGDEIKVSGSVMWILPAEGAAENLTTAVDQLGATIYRPASELLGEESSTHPAEVTDEQGLRRYAERLKLFNELHVALGSPLSLQDLLDLILERAFDHLGPEQGVIFLRRRGNGNDFERVANHSATGVNVDMPLSRSLIQEVCVKGMAALVLDTATDARFAQSESIIMAGLRSLLAAPLLDQGGNQPLGMIVLSTRAGAEQFGESDLEFLVSMASIAAMRIRNARLAEEAAERRRMQEQLSLARRIQVSLLPAKLPELPSLALHATNLPSLEVSGDYYDVIVRNDGGECVLMVADVSGKGVPASLLTSYLSALSAASIEDGLSPDEICRKVSRQLCRHTPPEQYATGFLAAVNLESGKLSYTNAGHNPALLVRASGDTEELGTCGMPLGLLDGSNYERREVELAPGDTLIIYTDGITEAESASEDQYGLERLCEVSRRHCRADLEELAEAIEDDLEAFVEGGPFHDDRTLLMARRR